jgi:hypothetical protein
MNNQAAQFLDWCKEHHNSPDIINLRWWLTERTTFGYPGDAECNAIMKTVKEIREML